MHSTTCIRFLTGAAAIVCASTISIPTSAKAPPRQQHQPAERKAMHGSASSSRASGRSEQWDITVTRATDRELEGHVTRSGRASLQGGRLHGAIAGSRVSGTVTDSGGALVATFIGTINRRGGMRGSFHDRTGASGQWSWDGPLIR